jgi:carboxyl-terminal processing protease
VEHPDDVVRLAYRILVEQSRLPIDATQVRAAASAFAGDRWRAIFAMARAANDPHTMLLTPNAGSRMQSMVLGGAVATPGFSVHRSGDRIVVNDVYPGGPAEKAGLASGDVLLSLDGALVERGMEEILQLAGAAEGFLTRVRVERGGAMKELDVPSTPWEPPFVSSKTLSRGVGYVRLRAVSMSSRPERDAASLLRRAVSELGGSELKSLILDLRSNPGGYGVSSAASVFTDRTPLCRYRDVAGTEELVARKPEPPACACPIVVLVDDQTLSSAEMITLALQDYGAARVVGVPTAGGLTVPRYVPLADGYVLMAPDRFALGPQTGKPPPNLRIHPDVVVPNRSAEDLRAGRDAQLDRAIALV